MPSNPLMIRHKGSPKSLCTRRALESAYDQTQVDSDLPMIRAKCSWQSLCRRNDLESSLDQTQGVSPISLCSNHSWPRLSCAWSRLWSDSVALEVNYDQTQVHLKLFMIRFKRIRQSPYVRNALKSAYDQTQVCSNPPMIRFKCARQPLCALSALESS